MVEVDPAWTRSAARAVRGDLAPEAIATLLGAIGDGLLLHALLDPEVDTAAAIRAVRTLLQA